MKKIVVFIKNEMVLTIAALLAAISAFFVKPGKEYLSYPDYRVLVLLFALMLVVAGMRSLGIFSLLGEKMCESVKNTRQLAAVFVGLCFVLSMVITNDVALITFVPFTISVFAMSGHAQLLIPVIVLETIAANLGSMLTPIGNPQNLLLFSISGMSVTEFIAYMFPLTLMSFLLISACLFFVQKKALTQMTEKSQIQIDRKRAGIYFILFLVCLGNVFHLYSHWLVLLIVTAVVLVTDKTLFAKVDYSLLVTFIGFFIFIGNMKQIETVHQVLTRVISGNEFLTGVLLSQIISNVPAAMLLSGFTTDYKALLYGVNTGGLGTLIASMASLISYRLYGKEFPDKKKTYFIYFTVCNVVLLLILSFFVVVVKPVCL